MPSTDAAIARACLAAAVDAGRTIRALVHAMPPEERARVATPLLKPGGGYGARRVDAEAEKVGLARLERLAHEVGHPIAVLVEPATGVSHRLGPEGDGRTIWASMDAIDGTVKVAGLGAPQPDRVRLANDGGWAAAFAFTAPTATPAPELTLGDFTLAAVIDGNPPRWRAYPEDLVVQPEDGCLVAREVTEGGERRVYTTSSEDLGQLWAYLDVFQAYDLATRRDGDEALGIALYRLFVDRHGGGAFDVLRQYANLSALARVLLGWREPPVWVESQGAAFIVVNENLANLIPSVPLIAGAGGLSVDFDGRPLQARRLSEGRTSVLHAANAALCERILALVKSARESVSTR